MWYSYKGCEYQIGYAESLNGVSWERKDDLVDLPKSSHAWDSQMMAYPYVFTHGEKYYMFYNGNNYGEKGIGIATAE